MQATRAALVLLLAYIAGVGCTAVSMGPLHVLSSNPRYFSNGRDQAVYLTGSHHWHSLVSRSSSTPVPPSDFDSYLNFLALYDHNFIRMWAIERGWDYDPLGGSYYDISPFRRVGPGLALDGGPKYDVDAFDQDYFDRLRKRVSSAKGRGVYVSIMLFNGWSVISWDKTNAWRGHPFHRENNINGIDGDLNQDDQGTEVHTIGTDARILAIRARQEAYIRKVVDAVNDLDNVLYEIGNELGPHATQWQYSMIGYLRSYEATKPYQHPIGMTSNGGLSGPYDDTADLYASSADWISPSANGDDYKHDPPAADGRKVVISDTDHLWGIGGDHVWVWKSFTRGLNPIYMDPYGDPAFPMADETARQAMGHTRWYANKLDLAATVPRPELATTGYCLVQSRRKYLVYLPPDREAVGLSSQGGNHEVTVNLSDSSGVLAVEWFNPRTGDAIQGETLLGGGSRTLVAPFGGGAVLYLHAE